MTALSLLSLEGIHPVGWLAAAAFGGMVLLPLAALLLLTLKVRGKRRRQVGHAPVALATVPPDLARYGQPWIGRLAFLGLPVVQMGRPEGDGDPDSVTWHLAGAKDRTVGVLTGTLPEGGGRPGFALNLYTFLSDGRVIVTADRSITHRPPEHWSLVQQRYTTVEAQLQDHRAHVAAQSHEAMPVMPASHELTRRLAAEERAANEALVASGDYVPASDEVLRPAFSRLPKLALREFAAFVSGASRPPAHRKDVASTRKENTPGEEEEIAPTGASFTLTLEQMVEQDVRRYRKHANEAPGGKHLLLRIAVLVATLIFFTAAFGRETPVATVGMLLGIIAVHEFGHWLAMKVFGYRGMGRFFLPFFGTVDRGKKLHATPWQQLLVILAGPVPGLIAGMAVLVAAFFLPELPMGLLDLAGLAVVLNAFHLLPFLPLDGGKVVDLLVFRDLPFLRPVFTAISAIVTMLASFVVKSRAVRVVAIGMFAGLIWDIKMIKVVRGGRRLGWAGSIDDEDEALRRIFRGVREEENESFLRSHDWQRQIDVLLAEVLRKRPGIATRIFGGWLYGTAWLPPLLLIAGLGAAMFVGSVGQLNRMAKELVEFQEAFPMEKRALTDVQWSVIKGLVTTTRELADEDAPRAGLAAKAAPKLAALDRVDWTAAGIAHHCDELTTPELSVWLEILCGKLESAVSTGSDAEAVRRSEVLLFAVSAMEPAMTLADRELLWDAQLRTLGAIEKLAAGGKLDAATLKRLDARLEGLNKAPVPEVDNMLLVAGWGQRQAQAHLAMKAGMGEMDARFWRRANPETLRFLDDIKSFQNSLPGSVALARYWKKTRRVGDLPPALGEAVQLAPGEAEFIAEFCEDHRRISWRRMTTLCALRLEVYRQNSGAFPDLWKHSVPGGATMELVKGPRPMVRLTDRRDQIQRAFPEWLGEPGKRPEPLDYLCPLFGSR